MAGVRAKRSKASARKKTGKSQKKKMIKLHKNSKFDKKKDLPSMDIDFPFPSEDVPQYSEKSGNFVNSSGCGKSKKKQKRHFLSNEDAEIISSLIKVHGRNFKAMLNHPANYKQFSAGKLKTLCERYLSSHVKNAINKT
ncbi:hypothetical protein RF11_15118 [Thelohanellus kitauei]|uniref:Uncharacterized protein n=1 Tax=Thelohanellus kitauei TaxID=669202 RepID=A0A0C2MLJ4_THEKT|nr:hypothetical protein RF11_15118 [Thelohanellus kitauei]